MNNKHSNTFIVDSVMGSGKTNGLIAYAKQQNRPLLLLVERNSEVARIKEALGDSIVAVDSVWEDKKCTKMHFLEQSVQKGKTLVSTHQLMRYWSSEFLTEVKDKGYELIIDEALSSVMQIVNATTSDIKKMLDNKQIIIDKGSRFNRVCLGEPDDEGNVLLSKYTSLENIIRNKSTYLITNKDSKGREVYSLLECLREDLWDAFVKVKILTYQFEGSLLRCYFDLHGMDYELMSLADGEFGRYFNESGEKFKPLVTFLDKHNNFADYSHRGRVYEGMSVSWLTGGNTRVLQDRTDLVQKNVRNAFYKMEKLGATKETFAYTFHKTGLEHYHPKRVSSLSPVQQYWNGDRAAMVRPISPRKPSESLQSYTNRLDAHRQSLDAAHRAVTWIPQNIRGVNEFRHKKFMAYLSNTYVHGTLKSFLISNGVHVDEEAFALSQCTQWLYRGCIREGLPMTVWVPCRRMRVLVQKWLGWSSDEIANFELTTNK